MLKDTIMGFRACVLPSNIRSIVLLSLVMYGVLSSFGRQNMTKIPHAVEALSTVTTTTPTRRIFCFGDSLTAGTSPPGNQNYPYAPHLEASLNRRNSKNGAVAVVVRHLGYPGYTSEHLLEDADDEGGLRTMIRRIQDPSPSLVILLAGTNDLGYRRSVEDIVKSITSLHQLCYQEGTPHTIAIGIPPSGYQHSFKEAAECVSQVNQKLQAFCESNNNKATFVPFPFEWAPNDDNWSSDGLHFSSKGYQVLGESLGPVVERMILGEETQKEDE
jgi:lysophospholipase L1-like esterase